MRWKSLIIMVLAVGVAAATFQFWAEHSAVVNAGTVPVERSRPDRIVAAGGLVEPVSEARDLAAGVVGRLVKMNVGEGDEVKAGDIVAEIENGDLKAELAAAEAAVAVRANELERLLAGAREQERGEAQAAVREAEAIARMARLTFARRHALGDKSVASQEAIDQARSKLDASEARKAVLAERLSLLLAPPRSENVAIAKANLAVARARVDQVSAQIEKTLIRSPIDGLILKRYRRAGETVTNLPPTLIATVGDIAQLRVRADVDEADIALVAVGQSVWVTADGYHGRRFMGTVTKKGLQFGRKNFRTEQPAEHLDTNILEVLIDLQTDARLPIGLRVDVIFNDPSQQSSALTQ